MTSVSVIGTGRMGAAMALRLVTAGHEVTVFNRTPRRASGLGARVAASAAEAASLSEIVLVSLADDAAVRAVYPEMATGMRDGAVVVETSTIHPNTVRTLGSLVETLIDAPVSGSVPVVRRGELTFMVGGPAEALDKARPILDTLGTKVFHLGILGSGATMKLAVNAVVHALNQALAESLVMAEKAGVDRALAYDVYSASAVAAPYVHYKREAFLHPEQTPVAFALELVAKDLELIASLAKDVGADMRQLETNRRIVAEAVAAGLGEHDMSAIAACLR